jgi:hypothetical protein
MILGLRAPCLFRSSPVHPVPAPVSKAMLKQISAPKKVKGAKVRAQISRTTPQRRSRARACEKIKIAGFGKTPQRHSRESGNPFLNVEQALRWIAAFARMTLRPGFLPSHRFFHTLESGNPWQVSGEASFFAGTDSPLRGNDGLAGDRLPGFLPLLPRKKAPFAVSERCHDCARPFPTPLPARPGHPRPKKSCL